MENENRLLINKQKSVKTFNDEYVETFLKVQKWESCV